MATHHHNFSKLLTDAGFKVTAPRLSILEVLCRAKRPVSADALFLALKGAIDRVTLYRNLKAMTDKGILYQTDFRTGKSLYELQDADTEHSHHHHCICSSCGSVQHVDVCIPEQLGNQALRQSGFSRIESHVLEFFGRCSACSKKIVERTHR